MPNSLPEVPDTARYVHALTVVEERITKIQRELLVVHWSSPYHTTTARKLAAKTGLSGYRAVNSHYGRLGKLLREEMRYTAPGVRSNIISWFDRPRGEWRFHMHPQLAAALEQLGWVNAVDRATHANGSKTAKARAAD